MIICPTVSKQSIRRHYDLATPFYRLLWGPHLHHGFWENEGQPGSAQQRLLDRLALSANIRAGDRVLDVGCGMGGSTIALAARYRCTAIGLTLSSVQRAWGRLSARWHGVSSSVRFRCADADQVDFPPESFDVVWNVECSEHLFDKPGFFHRAAKWLKPSGRIAVCAWLAGDGLDVESHVQSVGEGFLCPSFGTFDDYIGWLKGAGLTIRKADDLTQQVAQTWDICKRRVERTGVARFAGLFGRETRNFVNHFATLGAAYRSGAMRYGLFVAERTSADHQPDASNLGDGLAS